MIPRLRFPTAPLAGLLASGLILTARAAPPAGPDVREFLVPRQHLMEALKATPKAVLLTADQVAVLLRDARPEPLKPVLPPPVPAVLQKAHYHGVPGDRFVTLRGEFEVECLTDTWTEVPLELHPRWLGRVEVDGASAVQTADGKQATATAVKLLVQGKGRHALTIDFAVPVVDEAGRRHLEMTAPGAAEATLILTLPDKVKLESAEPFVQRGSEAVVALPVERRAFRLSWSRQDLAPLENAAVFQEFRTRYTLDPVRLEADLALKWQSPLRPLPGQLVLPLPPDATVMAVEGPELRQWTLAGDRVVVDFLPGIRQDASLRLVLERGLTLAEAGGPQQLPLPAPVADGVGRASGQFSIFTTGDLRLRSVNSGPLAERDDSRTPPAGDRRASGTWVFPVLPADPVVELQALRVQFAALLDTQISLTREAVRLKRWLTLTPRDGTLFSPKLEGLAAGEDIESVTTPDGSPVTWRKTERGVVFPDNKGIAAGSPWTVVVSSRLDPAGWQAMTEASQGLSLGSAAVPGAGKVNGYVALDFEDALFVRTTTATGLEPRDPRQFAGVLPLTGRMAWSRLEDFRLDLAVSRRAPEFDAAVVLYALPLLNSLEVEGALTLTIDRSPLREARVMFPAEVAAAVRWDSPLLAESSLEPDNSWRLRFHQETEGAPVLRFRLSVPQTDATEESPGVPGGMGPERRFKVAVPLPAVPGARRLQGAVVVEANTDTELTPQATGMNSVDTLKAPALDGYRPRHRLVSAWAWLGGSPSLTVSGVRHRPGDLVATVVDRLTLDTVVSQDGPVRHQARMEVRTAGGQYLDVILPEPARVLTLLVNEAAVKPVRNRQGGLRVPLPANLAVVRLICECPGEAMTAAAQRKLIPITLDPALPVLETTWQLHLPDGFTYSGFDSNLTPVSTPGTQPVPGVVGLAMAELNPFSGVKLMARGMVEGGKAASDDFLPGGGGGGRSDEQKVAKWRAAEKERVERITAALNFKLKTQEAEVEESRTEMMQLMKQYGIVDMSVATGRGLSSTLGTSDDSYHDSKRSELDMQTQVATMKANLENLQKVEGEQLIESAMALGIKDDTIETFANKYKTDKVEMERLIGSGMGPNHPKVVGLRKEIEEEIRILQTAAGNYRASLGITIKNLENALASVREISSDKKMESIEEKQRSSEYAQSKKNYEMRLDLLNQMRETFLKTQVNELIPRMPYGEVVSKGMIFGNSENRFRETRFPEAEEAERLAKEQDAAAALPSAMETRMFRVPVDFLSKGASPISGLARRPDAMNVLTQLGIEFGEGATATFAPGTETIVIRNTAEQLANADSVLVKMMTMGKSSNLRSTVVRDSDREGILPLDFPLPEGGRVYAFAGQYAPGAVEFRYQSWERRMRWSWFWMIAGAGLFWILTRRSPWFMGLLGLLLLQFVPVVLGRPEWLPAANALVLGWLAGAALRVVRWVLRRGKAAAPALEPNGPVVALLVALLVFAGGKAQANEAAAKAAPEAPVVVVPYDPDKPAEVSSQRYLSYETFERLWAAAKENRARQAAAPGLAAAGGERGATLTNAWHRAVVQGAVLRVEAVFALQTRGPDWVSVPFGLSNGLRSLTLDGAAAALKDGQLLVEKAGAHTISAAYDVPLPAGWQEVSWPVPAATATSLALSLAMEDPARPVVNGGAPLAEEEAAGRRVFTATLGNTAVISLKRRTTADRAGVAAAVPPLANVRTRVYLTPALERVESAVAFTFAGQQRRAFSLRMEAGLIPVSFSVPGLENWSLRRDGGMQVLDLNLERAVPDEFSLSLVAERPVAGLPLTENAPQVSAAADRVELEWSVLATDDLEVRPQAGAGLQRAEFVRGPGTDDEGFDRVGTWQATGVAQPLRWELRAWVPEAAAVVRYALQPGAGKLELSAGMELRPAPGRELRELTIKVPAGSTIQGVTGERLEDWWHEDTTLHVRFSGGGAALIPLALNLTQPLAEGAAEVTFQPLEIGGFPKVSGSGLLIAPLNQEAVLRLAPGKAVLREVAPQEAGTGFTIRRPFEEKRGFVFEGSGWTATARLAPLVERYDVDWVMEAEVRDSWVALNARVLAGLTRGGVERISFATPAAAPEFRVTGDDVRETVSVVEGNIRRYTVSFQTLMTGAVLFTLTGQLPLSGLAELPDLEFAGAARTSRFVILNNKSEGELKVEAAGVEVTPREQVSFLPEELASGRGGAQFYAARAGWSMKLGVEKLETTAGQAALILQADLTTSLLRNGDVWQRAVYVVQNRSLQFLPVHLPADAEVISVSVGGVTTRADVGVVDGLAVMLVPLIQTNAGELASEVRLIYRRRGTAGVFPQGLEDPDLPGLSVGQTFWTVQYPDGYLLKPDGGNMTATDDSSLVTEKALSRLSELVSLRSIANSDKYDDETRSLSRRNAQNLATVFQSAVENGRSGRGEAGGEISRLLKEVQEDVVREAEPVKKVAKTKEGAEMQAKKFSYNKLTESQVQSLNQGQVELKASDLNLNDNVAWSATKGKKPGQNGQVKDGPTPEPINNRLSQIRRVGNGGQAGGAEMKSASVEGKPMGKIQGESTKDRVPDEAGARRQGDFSNQTNEVNFGNTRLNGGNLQLSGGTVLPPGMVMQKAADREQVAMPAKPQAVNQPGAAAAADPFAAPEKREDALAADGGSSLRSSGRNSLEGVFPEQRNARHFRKVKGDAVLHLALKKPWSAAVDPGAAGRLAGAAGLLLLGRWLLGRLTRGRVA